MAIPLVVLAFGSIVAGYVGVPAVLGGANWLEHFLEPSFLAPARGAAAEVVGAGTDAAAHASLELALMAMASLVALAGIGLAARIYLQHPAAAAALAERLPGLYRFLVNKGYVDEVYDEVIVQPIKTLAEGALWRGLDTTVIDGAVNGTGVIVSESARGVASAHTGSVRVYAVSILLGTVLVVGYCLWR
jgi:NADH-quinone oxidoreductase subunit L